MSKHFKNWYKAPVPKRGHLPTLPLLPKEHIGRRFKILVQPRSIPEWWPMSKIDFVGLEGRCDEVTRQFVPPYSPIYRLEIELDDGPFYWLFIPEDIELLEDD